MTVSAPDRRLDERVLIFAPVGNDALLTADILQRSNLEGCVCRTATALCEEFLHGAAAILLTEEALEDSAVDDLMACLGQHANEALTQEHRVIGDHHALARHRGKPRRAAHAGDVGVMRLSSWPLLHRICVRFLCTDWVA